MFSVALATTLMLSTSLMVTATEPDAEPDMLPALTVTDRDESTPFTLSFTVKFAVVIATARRTTILLIVAVAAARNLLVRSSVLVAVPAI